MTAWTSEPPRAKWHVWIEWNGKRHVAKVHGVEGDPDVDIGYPGTMCMWKSAAGAGCKRSVHPIPSAEVLAAMHKCADALAEMQAYHSGGKKACGHDYSCVCAFDSMNAALRALEEARRG